MINQLPYVERRMIFQQLFEPESFTYTYLLGCPDSGETVLIDPVLETVARDLEVLQKMGRKLTCTLETHIHADHVTGACKLRSLTDCKIAGAAIDGLPCRDIGVREGEPLRIGSLEIHPLFTPGHTDTHHAYLIVGGVTDRLFTGDALLIDACGRTDFQSGDAATLYRSIQDKIFSCPDDTLIYPGHDYDGRWVSSVAQEKTRNPRLKDGMDQQTFVDLMNGLKLPHPAKMDFSVPGNLQCGQCSDNMPENLQHLCRQHDQG